MKFSIPLLKFVQVVTVIDQIIDIVTISLLRSPPLIVYLFSSGILSTNSKFEIPHTAQPGD